MNPQTRTTLTLTGLSAAFLVLTILFLLDLPGQPMHLPSHFAGGH